MLMASLILLQSMVGSHGALGQLCLGGDDHHEMEQICISGCGHDAPSLSTSSHAHEGDCGCVDIAIAVSDIRAQTRDLDSLNAFLSSIVEHGWTQRAVLISAASNAPPAVWPDGPHHATISMLNSLETTRLLI